MFEPNSQEIMAKFFNYAVIKVLFEILFGREYNYQNMLIRTIRFLTLTYFLCMEYYIQYTSYSANKV